VCSAVVSQVKVRPDLAKILKKKKNICVWIKKSRKILFAFFFQIINRYLMVKKREKQVFWGRIINAMCENIYEGEGGIVCACVTQTSWGGGLFFSFFSMNQVNIVK
jgi:hypothetical protein